MYGEIFVDRLRAQNKNALSPLCTGRSQNSGDLCGWAVNREGDKGAFWSVGNILNLYLGGGSAGVCMCTN